jgi:hypothetical protein
MMATKQSAVSAPGWFTPAAIGAVLWEALGSAMFLFQAFAEPAKLPIDQRAAWAATPAWMNGAWAFAVVTGIAGAVLLVMRKRQSEPLLLLSFLAVVVQFSGMILVPALRNLTNSDDLFMPFIVGLICYGVWHLAHKARKEGWLA